MSRAKQDVVVIGAGVVGLATAYELSKQGLTVTVVEESEPGWATSAGNAGMVYPAAGEPMVNPFHMKAGVRWMLTRRLQSPFQASLLALPGLTGWGLRALGACNQKNYEQGKLAFQALGADALRQFEEYKKDGVEYEEHPGGFLATFIEEKEFERQSAMYSQVPSIEVLNGDQAREREPHRQEGCLAPDGQRRGTSSGSLRGCRWRLERQDGQEAGQPHLDHRWQGIRHYDRGSIQLTGADNLSHRIRGGLHPLRR